MNLPRIERLARIGIYLSGRLRLLAPVTTDPSHADRVLWVWDDGIGEWREPTAEDRERIRRETWTPERKAAAIRQTKIRILRVCLAILAEKESSR